MTSLRIAIYRNWELFVHNNNQTLLLRLNSVQHISVSTELESIIYGAR